MFAATGMCAAGAVLLPNQQRAAAPGSLTYIQPSTFLGPSPKLASVILHHVMTLRNPTTPACGEEERGRKRSVHAKRVETL